MSELPNSRNAGYFAFGVGYGMLVTAFFTDSMWLWLLVAALEIVLGLIIVARDE